MATRSRPRSLPISLVIAILTLAAFWPVRGHDFLAWDDETYLTGNPEVRQGLTLRSIGWAFTSLGYASNWHPLTWLSHMLDIEILGLNPGAHHLLNVCWHAATAVLLFLVLERMGGGLWTSAGVAALFALHPLHVESVAWMAERKDVLSAFFWVLTMGAWWRYARRPSGTRYLAVAVVYALGLMAKPMLVTLPLVLLLLDYWPLRRFAGAGLRGPRGVGWIRPAAILAEKLPLVVLAFAASFLTLVAQTRGMAVATLESFTPAMRLANAAIAYSGYLMKMVWPSRLAIFYPYPEGGWPAWRVALSLLFLVATTAWTLRMAGRLPFLFVGWFWYLASLLPVIGLVQIGGQPLADRYTYIPLIGVFLILIRGERIVRVRLRIPSAVVAGAWVIGLVLLLFLTRRQVSFWRDDLSLFERALAVTGRNPVVEYNLAIYYEKHGRFGDALERYAAASRMKQTEVAAENNLGSLLTRLGRLEEAVEHYQRAIRLAPEAELPHYNLARTHLLLGRFDEAETAFRQALRINPGFVEARQALASLLKMLGREGAESLSELAAP